MNTRIVFFIFIVFFGLFGCFIPNKEDGKKSVENVELNLIDTGIWIIAAMNYLDRDSVDFKKEFPGKNYLDFLSMDIIPLGMTKEEEFIAFGINSEKLNKISISCVVKENSKLSSIYCFLKYHTVEFDSLRKPVSVSFEDVATLDIRGMYDVYDSLFFKSLSENRLKLNASLSRYYQKKAHDQLLHPNDGGVPK